MSEDLARLEREAERLSMRDRARLVRRLICSLEQKDEGDIEQAWLDEAEKRLSGHRSGRTTARPGEDVFDEILSEL
ncbi:MAG: addiction module protein [Woeseiaceae bacterium]|nr:addiction module protein [Woeseiaceae bacterium]